MTRHSMWKWLTVAGLSASQLGCFSLPVREDAAPAGQPDSIPVGAVGASTPLTIAPLATDLGQAGFGSTRTDLLGGREVGDDGDTRVPPSVGEFRETGPWGTWLLENGGMLQTFVAGLATFGQTVDVTAMILNFDGTGRLFLRDRLTGASDCIRMFVLYDGDTLVLDFAAETTSDFTFNLAIEQTVFFFPVVASTRETLGIADQEGGIAQFSRQIELPEDVTCGDLEVVDRFDGMPTPQFFGDMVLLDGDLVFNSGAGQIERFDLETDTLGQPLGPTSSRLVQTTEDGQFWTHCGCGGSRDAFKRTLLVVTDTVSSEDEMGGPITFRAMAYDANDDRLWLHGRAFDNQFGRFFVMNTNGEPDLIEEQISFNRDLRALAFDGTDLWGIETIASQVIVRIDTETGDVLETYDVPDEDVSWSGLVFDEFNMYLLGVDLQGDGVILRVVRP